MPATAGRWPATVSQQILGLDEALRPGSGVFDLHYEARITGVSGPDAVGQALRDIIRRHETLRCRLVEDAGELWGEPLIEAHWPTPGMVDLRAVPEVHHAARLAEARAELEAAPLTVRGGDLLRMSVVALPEAVHLLLKVSHAVFDGTSWNIFLCELTACLAGQALPPLAGSFGGFAQWQRARGEAGEWRASEMFWQAVLAQAHEPFFLPRRPTVSPASTRGERIVMALEPHEAERLRALAQAEGTTWFRVALAAAFALVRRLRGDGRVLLGCSLTGRSQQEHDPLIGYFNNIASLCLEVPGEEPFRALIRRTGQLLSEAVLHQEVSMSVALAHQAGSRGMRRIPVPTLRFTKLPRRRTYSAGDVRVVSQPRWHHPAPEVPVCYFQDCESGKLELSVVFSVRDYDREAMECLLRQYRHLLAQLLAAPERPLAAASLVPEPDRARLPDPTEPLTSEWEGGLAERFHRQAQRIPGALALRDHQGDWSYRELAERSNQLAHELLAQGLRPGDFVALHGERGGALVCALIAVLSAGGAVMVLDAAYPPSALERRVRRVRPRFWLDLGPRAVPAEVLVAATESGLHGRLTVPETPEMGGWPVRPVSPPEMPADPDAVAYVMFTSGTTAQPKAVVGCQRPVAHFLAWHIRTFGFHAQDRFPLFAGVAHDPLWRHVFTPLWVGASLHIPPPGFQDWAPWLSEQRITVVHGNPALLRTLNAREPGPPIGSIRWFFTVGEALRYGDFNRLSHWAPAAALVNFYGTTETPQAMAFFPVPRGAEAVAERAGEVVPIGRGISDAQLLVLAADHRLAGIGEPGEIHIRTPYLSQGYLDDAEQSAAKFVVNPFTGQPGDLLYRTGDQGRYRPDGIVEFLGRSDRQVKVRGFRVELGAIEEVLHRHPGVSEAVVGARPDSAGELQLVAVFTSRDHPPTGAELRRFVAERLPAFMVPAGFHPLDRMPTTRNGKVSHEAIQNLILSFQHAAAQLVPPRGPTEQKIAEVWQRILGCGAVSREDNFFHIGGHSLLALRLVTTLQAELGQKVALVDLFTHPTVAQLAAELTGRNRSSPASPTSRTGLRGALEGIPLFHIPGWFGFQFLTPTIERTVREVCPYFDGLQFPGVDGSEPPLADVPAIASRLVEQIARVWPVGSGPICLSGHSFGGIMAYEVAQQLSARGQPVALVIMLDTFRLRSFQPRTWWETLQVLRQRVRMHSRGARFSFVAGLVRNKARALARSVAPPAPSVASGAGRPDLRAEMMKEHSQRASRAYVPVPYRGRVLLIQATEPVANNWLRKKPDPLNGWGGYVEQLEVISVAAQHHEVFLEPVHPEVVALLGDRLRKLHTEWRESRHGGG